MSCKVQIVLFCPPTLAIKRLGSVSSLKETTKQLGAHRVTRGDNILGTIWSSTVGGPSLKYIAKLLQNSSAGMYCRTSRKDEESLVERFTADMHVKIKWFINKYIKKHAITKNKFYYCKGRVTEPKNLVALYLRWNRVQKVVYLGLPLLFLLRIWSADGLWSGSTVKSFWTCLVISDE